MGNKVCLKCCKCCKKIYCKHIKGIIISYESFNMKKFIKDFAWDEFAQTLKKERKEMGFAQWQLAYRLDMHRTMIAIAETQPHLLSDKQMLKIIQFLGNNLNPSKYNPLMEKHIKKLNKLCASKELDPYRLENAWKLFKEIQEMKPAKTHVWVSAS